MNRFLILLSLLAAAIACYSIGFARGAFIIVAIGVLFELGFWFGLFGATTTDNKSAELTSSDDK